jgi:hypothetical protein
MGFDFSKDLGQVYFLWVLSSGIFIDMSESRFYLRGRV